MRINPVANINFLNQIRVKIPDKTLNKYGYKKSDLGKTLKIADKYCTGAYIGEDVILLSSSPEIKNDLKKANLNFEEIGDVI